VISPSKRHQPGVWQRLYQRIGRTSEISIAEDNQNRTGHGPELLGSDAAPPPPQTGGQGGRIIAGGGRKLGEGAGHTGVGGTSVTAFDSLSNQLGVVLRKHVCSYPTNHQTTKTGWHPAGHGEQQLSSHRKANGVDWLAGQHPLDALLEILVGVRIMGFVGGAMAEQVDRDDVPASFGEQVDPSRLTPFSLER
jgi:hypothetical protein